MKEKELKLKLKQRFQLENWKEILPLFFKKIDYFSRPEHLFTNTDRVVDGRQVGTIKLDDGKQLAIFTIEVKDNVNIVRNRKDLRDIAAKHIDQNIIHGALAFFFNEKQADYRFSFIAKEASINFETGELIKEETKPKRYTYLLGPNEACTTPAKRMLVLADKRDSGKIDINQLKDVFSVETLNKDFFKSYKAHYEKFWKHLASEDNIYRERLIDAAKGLDLPKDKKKALQEKPIRDFVKKLLGRIVFLHFLQKKGWMGCSNTNGDWLDGEPRFMQLLFDSFSQPEKFHSQCLTKLFFNTLNSKRTNDRFKVEGLHGKLYGSRVPYLNGGLFEPDKNRATLEVDFPVDYFKELFDFFEQYNFTVDENSPEDHEVGIDPEMLGHIFENLLEENREKGAFYTPKEIVQYMCQESLIQYLLNTFSAQKDIELFVRQNSISPFLAQRENAILLNQKLDDIKVCDPAIGSGAFPIGMLQEIFETKRHIYPHLKTNQEFKPAEVKKRIIQNSIYGVDLEKGAVDIAQLRFWLSLVVEELNPHPLPNLDYKIMQGNSLLEQYEGIDLSRVANFKEPEVRFYQADMFAEPNQEYGFSESNRNTIKELLDEYYIVEDKSQKNSIHKKIDKIVMEHIDKSLEFFENRLLIEIATYEKHLHSKTKSLPESQKTLFLQKSKELKEIEKRQEQLESKSAARKRLQEFEETDERPYFLWHLYFMDVFEQGGFDIVIGNPPYIQLQSMGKDAAALESADFDTFAKTGDIYCLFYEKGNQLLKEKSGILTYITSNKWMSAAYGKNFRKFLTEKTNPTLLIDFSDAIIFPTAVVFVNILMFKSEAFDGGVWAVKAKEDYKVGRDHLSTYINEKKIFIKELNEDNWTVVDKQDYIIKNRLESIGTKLKDWDVQFNAGIKTAMNPAFHIPEERKNELIKIDTRNKEIIKPMLRGKDIKRWTYTFKSWYLINSHNGIREKNIPPINVEKDYPSIYSHFLDFYDKNSPKAVLLPNGSYQTMVDRKDQGDHWTNLRNCAFLDEFEKEKIVWIEISDRANYCLDNSGYYLTNSAYFLTGKNLKYLVAVLNSRVMDFYHFQNTAQIAGGRKRYTKQYVELLPIPKVSQDVMMPFEVLTDYLIHLNDPTHGNILEKTSNEVLNKLFEDVLNLMVYEIYFGEEMTSKEIDILKFINFPNISQLENLEEQKTVIRKVYFELQQKDNPVRNRLLVANTRSETIARVNAATV
ncbi:Eco57I restriction-modification methylase domain-containing protein [Rufibacter psychrotolerans]|uniref:Eco57I restriction-modification methylase domain-containing protein n=1 Tax=Rufibacter psychrotolerans TaxID=2812556 RepID=UPI0019688F5E|nr:TaqI-like C-terminal specificity domain-containing protein [Rufibacter sp. SYSU D00308]